MKKLKMIALATLMALFMVGCGGSGGAQSELEALDFSALLPELTIVEEDGSKSVEGTFTNTTPYDISLAVFYYSDKAANENGSFTASTVAAGEQSEKMEAYAPEINDVKDIEVEAVDINFNTDEGNYCVKYDYKEGKVLESFEIE